MKGGMGKRRRAYRTASVACVTLLCALGVVRAQLSQTPTVPAPTDAAQALPNAPGEAPGRLLGSITDTDGAAIPGAKLVLEDTATKAQLRTLNTDGIGNFIFSDLPPGAYMIKVTAHGFSSWKIENIALQAGEEKTLTTVELGVEAIDTSVNAIFSEDLAEREITAEEHQRILGVLPNFYVSYLPRAQPLTRRQKFKLALVISRDPLTFMTTGITAGIEQAQGDFAGYGPGFSGYAQRYAASYGDRLSATFIGSAILPSLLHQDPRYFYNGHGSVLHRALYAVSTVVICKGDNGRWQPNYSNVFGNLASGGISSLYYPNSARHDIQTSVDNIFIGIGEGSIGTLFQEFLLRRFTHGTPPGTP
jgi:hypothetical protein